MRSPLKNSSGFLPIVVLLVVAVVVLVLVANGKDFLSKFGIAIGQPQRLIDVYKGYENINKDILATLPTKSPDGKDISPLSISDDGNYVIFNQFFKQRGAGNLYIYLVYDRTKKVFTDLDKLIAQASKDDPETFFVKQNSDTGIQYKFTNDLDNATTFLAFGDDWVGGNPAFGPSDGFQSPAAYWVLDLKSSKFHLYNVDYNPTTNSYTYTLLR